MPEGVPKLRGKSQSLKKKKKPEPEESVNLDRAGVSEDSNACNRHRGLGRQPWEAASVWVLGQKPEVNWSGLR